MIVPVLLFAGAGGVGLFLRARAKKKNLLSKVPGEPSAGNIAFWNRGAYTIVVRKELQGDQKGRPFVWGVWPRDVVDKAPGVTTLERVSATAENVLGLIAGGAPDYASAVEVSQYWVQGLIGNAPPAPPPADYVVFGRGKGLLTIVIGQVPAPPAGEVGPDHVWQPTVPPTFVWAVVASSFVRDALSAEAVLQNAPDVILGTGTTTSYPAAVKAADDKAKGITFALWGHKPPYGQMDMVAIDAALRRRKKGA